jgi:ATP-dependent protease ClpP protease subunit
MIKLAVNDVIAPGYISDSSIKEQLKPITPGEEIEIEINSPGGYCVECNAIFNTICEYAKTHPVSVFINGIAASAASIIAIAARTVNPKNVVKVRENSIFFIHNPLDFEFGDYRAMLKMGDYLQRLAAMFANIYSGVTGETIKKTQSAMDEETYYIGGEIKDAGFATELDIINQNANPQPEARASMIASVEMRIADAKRKIREIESVNDYEKAAALLETTASNMKMAIQGETPKNSDGSLSVEPKNKPGEKAPAGRRVGKMTPEELLAQNPELYKAIFALGQNAERERVTAHLKLAAKSQAYETASKFITEGASVTSEAVQSEYLALAISAKQNENRLADNPPNLQLADDGSDDAKLMALFENGYSGKPNQRKG